ncbi:GNAT family N-acetyltransferase [Legionella sp. km772]|uniref:GNAT family N-acetyltransferase n=1 Tax=Legionella sp. km772 TaxID=2498111 RepID=UPI000F8CC8AF|nr:GNAT family N-acetyltransferase [Legionella sp. km772]RUR08644.1 GNAT family N-acetyltransferase [Legionella sp. km772]
MTILLRPLEEKHFTLLLKWLQMPHVQQWWDKNVTWTEEHIKRKYSSYTRGYKLVQNKTYPIHAFMIYSGAEAIGYMQYYNARDFPRSAPLDRLPKHLAALDIYIGEPNFLNKGLASEAINYLISHYLKQQYTHLFVDPDLDNKAAIKAYTKAGFELYEERKELNELWMVRAIAT